MCDLHEEEKCGESHYLDEDAGLFYCDNCIVEYLDEYRVLYWKLKKLIVELVSLMDRLGSL